MIGIINHRAGNLNNLKNAFDFLGINCKILNRPEEAKGMEKLVLPGVGNFGHCIENLRSYGFAELVQKFYEDRKPVLGICVGMHLFFSGSTETSEKKGLNLIPGEVVKFKFPLKVPQIGWNKVSFSSDPLFKGIFPGEYFYFLHSYYCTPIDESLSVAVSDYGNSFCCTVKKNELYGVQFHPEKSHKNGLQVLKNFSSIPVC